MRILSFPDRLLDGVDRTADSFAGRRREQTLVRRLTRYLAEPDSTNTVERPGMITERLVTLMDSAVGLPGVTNAWTMPIKGRIDMLATGIRTPRGVGGRRQEWHSETAQWAKDLSAPERAPDIGCGLKGPIVAARLRMTATAPRLLPRAYHRATVPRTSTCTNGPCAAFAR